MRQTKGAGQAAGFCGRLVKSFLLALLALSNAPAAVNADTRAFAVEAGDQLQVVVYGEESVSTVLSGRFRIEPDGAIDYPLLGRLEVAGLNPAEVADLLAESLSVHVRISPPSVSVAEYAPVFLVGDVVRSGPFQFQPGMTVFQLLLQAGGLPRSEASESARLTILQELASLQLTSFSLKVQRARILAEIDGVAFDPQVFAEEAKVLDAESIISAETAIYETRQRARASRRRTYQAQTEGYDQEIASIEKSIALHDEEVRLLEEQLDVQTGLAERGLAAHSVRREAQRQLTASRREALEFRTALFRARQNRIAVGQALDEAEIRLDQENVDALREVELASNQNEIALRSVQARYAQFETDRGGPQNALGRVPRYRITRVVDGEYTSRAADAFAELERGDIVSVTFGEEVIEEAIIESSAPQGEAAQLQSGRE